MALIIGVNKSSKIQVGDKMVKIGDILPTVVMLKVEGGEDFMISDKERTEILPDVFVSLGLNHRTQSTNSNRLAFEAPMSVKINRVRE